MSEIETQEFFSSIKDLHLGHQRAEFFSELSKLPPQRQCKRVKAAVQAYPGITNTKEFVEWGIRMAEYL